MKILLLADPSSSHTLKWANSFAEKGLDVFLFGLSSFNRKGFNPQIRIYTNQNYMWVKRHKDGSFVKVLYLQSYFNLKKLLNEIKPDILHAHYASSYGLLGSLMNYHPFVLSVWGNDITLFPLKSPLHKAILKNILKKADIITATSNYLKSQLLSYSSKEINVVPFGVDLNNFKSRKHAFKEKDEPLTIGIFKSLENHYGIELLINAFKKVVSAVNLPLKLLIVGGGSLETDLKVLVRNLSLTDSVQFIGKVDHSEMGRYQNLVDIAVYPSIRESFGVAVLESSACEIPVVVSDIGGLAEVTLDNQTGIVFPRGDVNKLAEAIEKLILNPSLREKFGSQGRKFVQQNYDWNKNVNQMIKIYNDQLKK